MNRLYNITLLIFLSFSVYGQNADTIQTNSNLATSSTANQERVEIKSDLGLVTTFLNNALLSNDYWTDRILQDQVDNLGNRNRLGAFSKSTAYYHTGNTSGLYFGVSYKNITGLVSQKEPVEVVLRGNKNVPTILIENRNAFERIGMAGLTIGKERYDSSKHMTFSYGLTLLQRQFYSKFTATDGMFITDSSGEQITVSNANAVYAQELAGNLESFGLGLQMRLEKDLINNDRWTFSISDLGIIRSSNYRVSTMKSGFTFDGFDVSSQVSSAGGIEVKDSVNQNYFETDTTSKLNLAPFETSFRYIKSLGASNFVDSKISYLYFAGYYPLLETSYLQKFKSSQASWSVGARIGGFGSYGLLLGAVLPINNKHLIRLNVAGLESMASNNLPVYWYGQCSLRILI
jgi:hypothetical protein